MVTKVKKRDGSIQNFSPTKLNKWAEWACSNTTANWSELSMAAIQKLPEEVSSKVLQKTLIETAIELISHDYEFDKVAARLLLADLRKDVFNTYNPPALSIYAEHMHEQGYWDDLLSFYTEEEIILLEAAIDHSRDELFTCGGLKQAIAKYLKKDYSKSPVKILETPQFMYMGMAMALRTDPNVAKHWPIEDIIGIYDEFSLQRVNVPTPPLVGLRTGDNGFASCCLIEAGDSIDSLDAAASAVFKMVANRAGIGYNAITRSLGEGVRNNSFHHTGKLPFYRHIDKATKALIQGVRGGAATVHYTFIDPEIEVLLNLKSQRSADDVRIEFLDYCMVYHPYFLELYKANKPLKLISYKDHPEVYDAMYSKVYSDFVRLYEKATAVKEVNARDVLHTFLIRRAETGRNYWMNSYEANVQSSFLEPIKQSNLCVKGDTNILTDKGYFPIATLEGATITVWNGETWSEVTVQKTGTNQKLLKVTTSQDKFIECTEYHKFYTINSNYVEQVTRAHELKAGDKLTRTILPVLDFGTKVLKSPYTNGFFTGDGTYDSNNRARIYFYEKGGKLPCVNKVDAIISGTGILDSSDRLIYTVESTLEPKYFVPDASYTIDSRVKWLEGFLDADGSLQNNGKTPSVVFSTSNKVFGENVAKLAESLGISIKKTTGRPEQFTMMPDGHGGYKEYLTAETYRYTVCSTDYWKLYDLGLRLNKMKDLKRPNRLCTQFEKVMSIVEVEGLHDTYCVTEPKRGKVVFNGILTGNCQEILQPTNAYSHVQDMYVYDEDVGGEISLCNLGGIVFGRVINYERTCYLLLKFIDTIIEMQHLPFPNLEYTSKARRNVAVGIINLANYLAKNGLSYEGKEARTLVYNECSKMYYYLHKASVQLAKEQGKCEWFDKTVYSHGMLPQDHDRIVDLIDMNNQEIKAEDWIELCNDIYKYGMRNSTLTACMPGESSSVLLGATNGVEPIRDILVYKKSPAGVTHTLAPGANDFDTLVSYQMAYDIDRSEYIKMMAVINAFMTQSISFNQYYNYQHFENEIIPLSELVKDFFLCNYYGLKTAYYHNSGGNNAQSAGEAAGCAGGGCSL